MKRYAVFGVGNIGFGVAEKLASDAEVCVFDLRKPDYLSELMAANERVSFTEVNATDEDSVETAVSSLQPGSLDGAVLTVGIASVKTAFEDLEAFKRTVSINFYGNIVPIRVLVRNKVFKRPAKIIVIVSTSGHFAGLDTNAYPPSKWMLANACGSVQAELEEQGITLDMINPRTIRNVRSDEFKSSKGIDVSSVVDAILKDMAKNGNGGGSRSRFIPGIFGLLHVAERFCPWVFDALVRLPPHAVRKRNYKAVSGSALITGASSGLGRELVRLYAGQCDRIYVTARNLDALNELKNELAGRCEIVPIQVDFKDADAVAAVADVIGDQKLSLLINNAGHHVTGSLLTVEKDVIDKTVAVNFFDPVELVTTFRDTPAIVNILSTTAIAGRRDLGVYSSTKAGLWCFSKALRRTCGRTVHVVDVIPASFKSSLGSKGDAPAGGAGGHAKPLGSGREGMGSAEVAGIVKRGIDKKRDVIYIPNLTVRAFMAMEAFAPGLFRKLFDPRDRER